MSYGFCYVIVLLFCLRCCVSFRLCCCVMTRTPAALSFLRPHRSRYVVKYSSTGLSHCGLIYQKVIFVIFFSLKPNTLLNAKAQSQNNNNEYLQHKVLRSVKKKILLDLSSFQFEIKSQTDKFSVGFVLLNFRIVAYTAAQYTYLSMAYVMYI